VNGIEWTWLALDGTMGKAPLGGEKTGRNLTDRPSFRLDFTLAA